MEKPKESSDIKSVLAHIEGLPLGCGIQLKTTELCLLRECHSPAILLTQDEYEGAMISWCESSHVAVWDPGVNADPKKVFDFRQNFIDASENLKKAKAEGKDHI